MGEGQLDWPPRKEDLQRLYVDEHLSAAKIAKLYGLKYANPKTAESTVLFHLKRAGIARRDPAEHVRKVTEEMVDGWVRRYQAGESLRQIAGDQVGAVTIFNHLRRRGIKLREKVEAQIKAVTKYRRSPFAGDAFDRAYLLGFVLGDCAVVRHGRAVRVRTATTHPAMAELFDDLFGRYGCVKKYPRASRLTGFEWSLEVDLDDSFEFLLDAKISPPPKPPEGNGEFLSYLAGFFDAEGGAYLHRTAAGFFFELYITSTEDSLILPIHARLTEFGYSSRLVKQRQPEDRLGSANPGMLSKIRLWKHRDVERFARVLPSKHEEKVAKLAIVREFSTTGGTRGTRLRSFWSSLLDQIKESRDTFVQGAKMELDARIIPSTKSHGRG